MWVSSGRAESNDAGWVLELQAPDTSPLILIFAPRHPHLLYNIEALHLWPHPVPAAMASPSPSSSSTALTKRNSDTALMPPPPPPKRIKRPAKVLDEDTYTDALDHIVARDFFPGLLEAQAQQEYMQALDSHNAHWIHDAARRLTHVMTPTPDGRRRYGRRGVSMTPTTPMVARAGETPRGWGGETPMSSTAAEETEDEKLAREEEETRQREREQMRGMSLNAFQSKYTSEDNESFNALLDTQNHKRAEKYAWMWQGNKIATGRLIAHREREQKLLHAEQHQDSTSLVRNNDRALVRHDPERDRDADTRPAMPDHRPAPPRNAFMFAPDSIEDTHMTVAQAAQDASTAPPKAIVYTNTRLPAPATDNDATAPSSPTLSAVNAALAGRPHPTASEAVYGGNETPRVNGYAFVDEDDPEPEDLLEADSSLLQRLGITADAGPNPFTIHQASKREALHHRLVDKTAKSKREPSGGGRLAALKGDAVAAAGKSSSSPMPKYASSPVVSRLNVASAGAGAAGKARGNLTPAAQRLFDKMGTPRRKEGGFGAFGGSSSEAGRTPLRREKVRWTPTPKVKRGA